ncbi:hypothetical protein PILCRDRAFT_66538 [Piloderma croceum F 1598]|uniref:Phytocyanin domain-containing protein n=1 Tax=Piloderma croceum (strain F 1598) TaxID=765440 RepID=A0A0C3G422_PILCF|nr:hypothetical protein PILCRDRAFT_66538 [Piloderma croceum F 1598]
MLFTTLSLVVFLPLAITQQVFDVQVGSGNLLTFSPDSITAAVGDTVNFHYFAKNHTATQSTFSNPCSFMEGGFDSGFMPVAENATEQPTFSIVVKNANPIWAYCAQTSPVNHCGQGMVFAVNAGLDGSNNSFQAFQNAALQIGAAAASSTASSGVATAASSTAPSSVATAAYGGVTIPPAPTPSVVTQAVTVGSSAWTTVYSSYPNSPAPTPASLQGNIIKVVVGGVNTLNFTPGFVQAEPRDTLVFEFQQKNHSIVQSSFPDPCRHMDGGIKSDFFPVAANATEFPTYNVTVNDTAPMWFYCGQQVPSSHCGTGMVFAVNPDQSSLRNYTAFQRLAEQLNGTVTAAAAGSNTGAAALSMRISGVAGVVLALGAVLAYLL